MIDDKEVDGSFGGDEFQAELLMNRRVEVRWGVGIIARAGRIAGAIGLRIVERPFHVEIVATIQASLVDDRFVEEDFLHAFGEIGDGIVSDGENGRAAKGEVRAVAGFAGCGSKLGPVFSDLDCVDGEFTRIVVEREAETGDEQLLEHQARLVDVGMAIDVGDAIDIKMPREEGRRAIRDLADVEAVSVGDELTHRHVVGNDLAAVMSEEGAVRGGGVAGLDGGDFECGVRIGGHGWEGGWSGLGEQGTCPIREKQNGQDRRKSGACTQVRSFVEHV